MASLGVYLIFAAVALRGTVLFVDKPQFNAVLALLAVYGLLLLVETQMVHYRSSAASQSRSIQLAYLGLQCALVIALVIITTYEDFFALLLIPLSLDAVAFFGKRYGFLFIAFLTLILTGTLLFSKDGQIYGLAMGAFFGGMCFLFGGYAHQVYKASVMNQQNQQTFNDLQVAHRQLQGYADQVTNLAAEHERNRLARDLHDLVTQTVFSMNLTAQSTRLLMDKEPLRVSEQLVRLEELASKALIEIQYLVSQLKPRSIAEEGLPAALRRMADERQAHEGLHVSLEIYGKQTLSESEILGLYAIAHEALTNVIKHSGSRDAMVRLNIVENESYLEIEDYGRSFELQAISDGDGHLGLISMSERAREIGWSLLVESKRGHGTCIRVTKNGIGVPA